MSEILSQTNYLKMPWKNGRGTTSQIAIDSDESRFPDNFIWRISSAAVVANDPFSQFEGCRRALVVVEGKGLLLNEVELKPFVPYYFSGREYIDCQLIDGPVVDVGVIFGAHKVNAEVEILRGQQFDLNCEEGIQFLYLAESEGSFAGGVLKKGDTLKVVAPEKVNITGNSMVGVLISIKNASAGQIKNKNF